MKMDRLIGILAALLQEDNLTAPMLAERFEVSRRTIQRDIDALSRAGIPIATRQGAGGGISIMEGYRLDRTLLTTEEMRAILAGLRSLDSVSGTRRYARLMEKLNAGPGKVLPADGHILIDLASWQGRTLAEKVERIHDAIEARRAINFRYHAPGGESERIAEPGCLVFQWGSWYAWAWCRARRDWRLFKLNRMVGLELLEPFEPRPMPLPDLSNERVFPQNFHVKARVAPEYRWRLVEEYGEDSFAEEADGTLRFEVGFSGREHAIAWILSFQGGAELLEPEALRAELRRVGEQLTEQYGE